MHLSNLSLVAIAASSSRLFSSKTSSSSSTSSSFVAVVGAFQFPPLVTHQIIGHGSTIRPSSSSTKREAPLETIISSAARTTRGIIGARNLNFNRYCDDMTATASAARLHHSLENNNIDSNNNTMAQDKQLINTGKNQEEEEEAKEAYDPLKWEKLYNENAPRKETAQSLQSVVPTSMGAATAITADTPTAPTATTTTTMTTTTMTKSSSAPSPIRVITFDLDNTLWKTSATISHANTVLSHHLQRRFGIATRSETEMGRLFALHPDRYCGMMMGQQRGGMEEEEEVEVGATTAEEGESIDENDGYAHLVVNVGRTDIIVANGNYQEEENERGTHDNDNDEEDDDDDDDDDDGVHIQSSSTNKKNTKIGSPKKPVHLTLLRKDAIRSLILLRQREAQKKTMATESPPSAESAPTMDDAMMLSLPEMESQVDEAFDLWMEARGRSISQNFAGNAVECLMRLRSGIGIDNVYIGAITDGNSDPTRIPEVNGIFDFVIRAEDVGCSKPDKRVYKAAVGALMVKLAEDGRSAEEFFLGESFGGDDDDDSNSNGGNNDGSDGGGGGGSRSSIVPSSATSWKDIDPDVIDAFSDAVGPWWVHVGDDFFKDIVASKEFRMRSVWSRELIIEGDNASREKETAMMDRTNGRPKKKERTVEDLMKDISKLNGVVEMSIGASEFLMSSVHQEFSDAIIDRFDDLGELLIGWHEEGNGKRSTSEKTIMESQSSSSNTASTLEIPNSDAANANTSTMKDSMELLPSISDGSSQQKKKFCVFCGEQVPMVAKFCGSCGERQI